MRFDDRLATVLRQPAADSHDRAVRWRQLVDLVARAGAFEHSPIVAEALAAIAADAGTVPEHLRAAAARAIAAPSLPFDLVRYFAAEPVSVAVPVLSTVQLSDDQWQELLAAASPDARRFIVSLRPGLEAAAPPEPPEVREPEAAVPSIGDVVARIERRREERRKPAEESAPPPAGERPMLFRWECDATGTIGWVEGAPRGALVGRSIARRDGDEGVEEEIERAFSTRAPFREALLELGGEGAVAGNWMISGIPAFSGGSFVGYRGVAVREGSRPPPRSLPQAMAGADPQSLRELVHELKTPLNAIIGFAEIIEAQMLGSADQRYRARAAEIVGQARLLLAAIDDLDLAARLQSERTRGERTADLGALLEAIAGDLADLAGERRATIAVEPAAGPLQTRVEEAVAERLVRRFCSAVIERAATGERLHASADRGGAFCRVSISQPRDIAQGGQLELRLVRGLARVIGGDVSIEQGAVQLALPAA